MLAILDASYVVNGEIEMDYTRFRECHQEARNRLGRLGIQLPSLNEGGDSAIFKHTLEQITYYASIGDYAGARRATSATPADVVQKSTVPTPPPRQPQPQTARADTRSEYGGFDACAFAEGFMEGCSSLLVAGVGCLIWIGLAALGLFIVIAILGWMFGWEL